MWELAGCTTERAPRRWLDRYDDLRPEEKLVILCARASVDPSVVDDIRGQLHGTPDWDHVVRTAARHCVARPVHETLRVLVPGVAPTSALSFLQQRQAADARRCSQLTRHLPEVCSLLQAAGVRTLAFKGPVLGIVAYGDVHARSFFDLDFLVDASDVARAERALCRNGFRLQGKLATESSFLDETGVVELDLHHGMADPVFLPPLPFEDLWQRRVLVGVAGGVVPTTSVEDLFFLLCLQASRDAWLGRLILSKVLDIHRVLSARPSLDWYLLRRHAETSSCSAMMAFATRTSLELFGPLPCAVPHEVVTVRTPSWLAKRTIDVLFTADRTGTSMRESRPSRMARLRFHAAVRERPRDKARPFVHALVTPSDADRSAVSLPPRLAFGYVAVRACRLALRAVRASCARWHPRRRANAGRLPARRRRPVGPRASADGSATRPTAREGRHRRTA